MTKVVCGNIAAAQTMPDGGAVALADIRLRKVERMRDVDLISPTLTIRPQYLAKYSGLLHSVIPTIIRIAMLCPALL